MLTAKLHKIPSYLFIFLFLHLYLMEKLGSLIQDIKKKKELKELSESFVKKELTAFFRQNPKLSKSLDNPRSAYYKQIVKGVRAKLRRVYGLFRDKDRNSLIKKLLKGKDVVKGRDVVKEILQTHSSTKERLPFYGELYHKIFAVTGKPVTIIDLGSGINPFSIPYMKLKQLAYHAYDLNKEEIASLNKYFKFLNKSNPFFRGKAEVLDITEVKKILPADIAFLFKMTDVIDRGKGHKKTEEVITAISAKYVIVSFPTITMSGKKMNFPRRRWIELMCRRLNYKFNVLAFSNELFYVIQK